MFSITDVGERIAKLRRAVGMTQNKLANELSISPQSISQWERGLAMPDIGKLPELADLLGVSIEQILTGTALPEPLPAEEKLPGNREDEENDKSTGISDLIFPEMPDIQLIKTIPFLDKDQVEALAEATKAKGKSVAPFVPYLSPESVIRFYRQAKENHEDVSCFMTYLPRDFLFDEAQGLV